MLKEKWYSEESINKVRSWGLVNRVKLPDLKEEKRVGVSKELSLISDLENNSSHPKIKSGKVADGVVFLMPRFSPIASEELTKLLTENNSNFFYSICGSKEAKNYEKLTTAYFINRILKKYKNWEYIVYFLETDEENVYSEFAWREGNSLTLSLYLNLLSVYHQKPISCSVVASGVISVGKSSDFWCVQCFQEKELVKNLEENFSKNKIEPVGGLEHKIPVAVKAGVKKIILSSEQKEDYEKKIPSEIKEKLKVYYVKNVEELEKLFWEGEFS